MTRMFMLAAVLCALLGSASTLDAQGAADQRASFTVGASAGAFLATMPGDLSPPDLFGFGGRVTLGLSALTGEMVSFLDYLTVGGFYFTYPQQTGDQASGSYYGAEIDLHFRRVPMAGIFDPFVSFGLGAADVNSSVNDKDGTTIAPGFGFRIPLAGRAELRFDGQYITILDSDVIGDDFEGNDQYIQLGAGLQLGF